MSFVVLTATRILKTGRRGRRPYICRVRTVPILRFRPPLLCSHGYPPCSHRTQAVVLPRFFKSGRPARSSAPRAAGNGVSLLRTFLFEPFPSKRKVANELWCPHGYTNAIRGVEDVAPYIVGASAERFSVFAQHPFCVFARLLQKAARSRARSSCRRREKPIFNLFDRFGI